MPPDGHRSEGTPSLSEVPYAWGEPFWVLFWRLKKVPRRKGETLSSRYRSNGYVHLQKKGRLSGRHRQQASSHRDRGHPQKTGQLSDRHRQQASSHRDRGTSAKDWSAIRPSSLASRLPKWIEAYPQEAGPPPISHNETSRCPLAPTPHPSTIKSKENSSRPPSSSRTRLPTQYE